MNKIIYQISMFLICSQMLFGQSSVVDSEHNLSVTGPGEFTASTETEICIFCHATHNTSADAPLWNRTENTTVFDLYGSPTLEAQTMQPGTEARLCLSCHDGTIAIGLVRNRSGEITFPVGMDKIPPSEHSNLGVDLSDDHPINLDMSTHSTGELLCVTCHNIMEGTSDNLQCTTCHNPHNNSFGDFLVTDPVQGGICILCHDKAGWDVSVHNTDPATWNGSGTDPWPYSEFTTVLDNACRNCHESHGNESDYWLLKNAAEEDNCLMCHNANVAETDLTSELLKPSVHPVMNYQNIHSPEEEPALMQRHVECTDCHNPHRVVTTPATAPDIPGALTGVSGIDQSGAFVEDVQYEYEICYKCHEDVLLGATQYVPRVNSQSSLRQEFSPSGPSYHPVVAPGQNPSVESLIAPLTSVSQIYCTDCHNNDASGDINGPHGSLFEPILADQMLFGQQTESSAAFALCYRCHDRNTILNPAGSGVDALHDEHLSEDVGTSCTTCHDPHGSYTYTHLINFDTNYVTPNRSGRLEYNDFGGGSGTCLLECHGQNHGAGFNY